MDRRMEEEEDIIGLEECFSWLPSHVLTEALFDFTPPRSHHHRHRGRRFEPPSQNAPQPPSFRSHQKSRYQNNRQYSNGAGAGAGMQAFFLVPGGNKSSGTGVFIPANGAQANKKPACSPVLLPSRVVEALNLNVHSLGLQLSPRQGRENNYRKKKSKTEAATRKCGANTSNNSPEIFLPKEWTY